MLLYISLFVALCSLCNGQGAPCLLSGNYLIANDDGHPQQAYCEVDIICKGSGWTRLGKLDMTQPGSECQDTLRLYEANGVKACHQKEAGTRTCDSVIILSHGIHCTQICGHVIGYHVPAWFLDDFNVPYVEGVSITYGSPQQHIWTLGAALYDSYKDDNQIYPCSADTTNSGSTCTETVGLDVHIRFSTLMTTVEWRKLHVVQLKRHVVIVFNIGSTKSWPMGLPMTMS